MVENNITHYCLKDNQILTGNKKNTVTSNPQIDKNIHENDFYNYLQYAPSYNAVSINLRQPQCNIYPPSNISILNSNINFGNKILQEFYKQFPNIESSTLLDIEIMRRKSQNEESEVLDSLIEKRDKMLDKYLEKLNKRIENKRFSAEDIIKDAKEINIANCGDRAVILDNMFHKKGYDNTKIVKINGDNYFNEHVFNVIGLDKNADITKPETWGNNATIVDAWANKVGKSEDIIKFYKNFLLYNANNQPMYFSEGT